MLDYNYNNLYRVMERTLKYCNVEYDNPGIDKNLDEWETHKAPLVELLRKHPLWNEEAMAIITKEAVSVDIDVDAVVQSCDRIGRYMGLHEIGDEDSFLGGVVWENLATQTITDKLKEELNFRARLTKYAKPVVGQKITRWLHQVFTAMGIPATDKEFWKLYQQLADLLNPSSKQYHLVISVNPADYLTMSYGKDWASCHIINPDIAHSRHGSAYEGCYKAGCLSYLGDESAIVTYTLSELPKNLKDLPITPRHTRQMFFVNVKERLLLQSRLYPYTTASNVCDERRKIMQGVVAQCFDIENKWEICQTYLGFETDCDSLHYRDYHEFQRWLSYPPDVNLHDVEDAMIGNISYCLVCGSQIEDHEFVHCEDCCEKTYDCAMCGHRGDQDEMHLIEGGYYCGDCCFWCEYHQEWEVGDPDDQQYVEDYGLVCSYALEESGEFFYENDLGEWLWRDQYPDCVETYDGYVYRDVETAFDHNYYPCSECGEWHLADDMHCTLTEDFICAGCYRYGKTETCPHCGEKYNPDCDAECPNCGVVLTGEAA